MDKLIQALMGRIQVNVVITKTVQERDYEPYVIELHEARWVKEEDEEKVHKEIYRKLESRMIDLVEEIKPGYYS